MNATDANQPRRLTSILSAMLWFRVQTSFLEVLGLRNSLSHRARIALVFAFFPPIAATLSFLFGELLTLSPHDGWHRCSNYTWMLFGGVANAPISALVGAIASRAFFYKPDHLFRYAVLGHFFVGSLVSLVSIIVTLFAFFSYGSVVEEGVIGGALFAAGVVPARSGYLWVLMGGLFGPVAAALTGYQAPPSISAHL